MFPEAASSPWPLGDRKPQEQTSLVGVEVPGVQEEAHCSAAFPEEPLPESWVEEEWEDRLPEVAERGACGLGGQEDFLTLGTEEPEA